MENRNTVLGELRYVILYWVINNRCDIAELK